MDVRDQIKNRISISEVASIYVDLKPAGKNLKALCPFHTEKTPSFFVMPDKDTFACYGCNKFGDIFTLVQEMEKITFPDAMNYLVEKFNIPIEKTVIKSHSSTDDYSKINDAALTFFRQNLIETLEGHKALQYLSNRGIHKSTIDQFSLGYSVNKWDGLYQYLRDQSYDIKKAIELGLLINNREKNRIYDRFRGRIIFPIYSESNALVAFGGRTIFNDPNKYLNSPDTPLYKKNKHLYGFNVSKQFIRELKQSILVEGYFDVISLFQNGVKNVVASLGTALTENQIYLLRRFSDNIYIYYDNDEAGSTATIRAIERIFEQNFSPYIVVTKEAKDPDDFIRKKSLKEFHQSLSNSIDGFKYLLEKITANYDLNIPVKKNEAILKITAFIEKISEAIIREEYVRKIADFFGVDEHIIKLKREKKTDPADFNQGLIITPAERMFIQSILKHPVLVEEVQKVFSKKLLAVLASRNIIQSIFNSYNSETKIIEDYTNIVNPLSPAEQVEFLNIFENIKKNEKNENADHEELIESSIMEFVDMLNKQELKKIGRKIKIAEKENNIGEVLRLMKEKSNYVKNKHINMEGRIVEEE